MKLAAFLTICPLLCLLHVHPLSTSPVETKIEWSPSKILNVISNKYGNQILQDVEERLRPLKPPEEVIEKFNKVMEPVHALYRKLITPDIELSILFSVVGAGIGIVKGVELLWSFLDPEDKAAWNSFFEEHLGNQ